MPTSDATEARVERWARALCEAAGINPEEMLIPGRRNVRGDWEIAGGRRSAWMSWVNEARAAVSLSDHEAAERVEAGTWAEWERLRTVFDDAAQEHGWESDQGSERQARISADQHKRSRAALDAFVLRHIALAEARGAVPEDFVTSVRCVYDTFKRDLDQGYKTRDKEFAVSVLGKALEALATAPRPASSTQAEGGGTQLRAETG